MNQLRENGTLRLLHDTDRMDARYSKIMYDNRTKNKGNREAMKAKYASKAGK